MKRRQLQTNGSNYAANRRGIISADENEILDSFFENDFQSIRSKHVRKRQAYKLTASDASISSVASSKSSVSLHPKTPGLGVGGNIHLSPLHVDDMHNVSNVIHRVTFQSGHQPAEERFIKTPAANVERASHASEVQFKGMMESDSMRSVLTQILQLNVEVGNIVLSVNSHRKELGAKLDMANKTYIKLFERMLSEVLMLQRQKFKTSTAENEVLKARVAALEAALSKSQETESVLRQRLQTQADDIDKLTALNNSRKSEVAMYVQRISELEDVQREYIAHLAELDEREREYREKKADMEAKMIREERMRLQAQQLQLSEECLRQSALHMQVLDNRRIKEARSINSSDLKNPKVDNSTQTEVDDEGIWDKQGGWVMPISGTVIARNRWRQATKFAACPSCRGTGKFVMSVAALLRRLQRGEVDTEATRSKGKWNLPDDLVQFMSNLPRTVVAIRPEPLPWVVRHVWHLFNLKLKIDAEDTRLSYNLQPMSEFLIETFLRRSERRIDAERHMYMLFSGLREYYKKHPLLHSFARFLSILDDVQIDGEMSFANVATKARRTGAGGIMKASTTSLPLSILSVYIFARSCLLQPYVGEYAKLIASAKENSPVFSKCEKQINSEADATWNIPIPKHVIITETYQIMLPLDRAVEVMKAILSFLTEKQTLVVFRHIEHEAMFLSNGGSLSDAEGMHTVVRATMRKYLNVGGEVSSSTMISGQDEPKDEDTKGQSAIVVNMERALQIMLETLLSRTKYVEETLKKQFVEGDENSDGVLSFKEFFNIVSKAAPKFSERRILKMFREALMRGNDDDHIDLKSFVAVCKLHGLIHLVDINELRKSALKNLMPIEKEPIHYSKSKSTAGARERISVHDAIIASNVLSKWKSKLDGDPAPLRSMISHQLSSSKLTRRQSSQTSSQEANIIRRNVSEEVVASKQALDNFADAMTIRKNVSEEFVNVLKRVDKQGDMSDSGSESSEQSGASNFSFPRYSQRKNLASMKDKILSLGVKGSAAPAVIKTPRQDDNIDSTEPTRFPRISKTKSMDDGISHRSHSSASSKSFESTSPKKSLHVIVPQQSHDPNDRVASDSSKILFAEPDLSDL